MLEAVCVQDTVTFEIDNQIYEFVKNDFGYIIVATDFVSIFLFAWFVSYLEKVQKQYHQVYDNQTIQLNDFTLRFKNIPTDVHFQGNEQVLMGQI